MASEIRSAGRDEEKSDVAPERLSGTVLVVEDEGVVALELEERVRLLGLEVCGVADSAMRAVDLAMHHLPDLVLMDIRLRGAQDGVAAAAQIRRLSQRTAIVFITAYADQCTLANLRAAEPDGFVLKPFQERALDATITTALVRRRAEASRGALPSPAGDGGVEAALFEQGPDAVLVFDARGTLVSATDRALEWVGGARGELHGAPIERFLVGCDSGLSPLDVHAGASFAWLHRSGGELVPVAVETFASRYAGQPFIAFRVRDRGVAPQVASLAHAAAASFERIAVDVTALASSVLSKLDTQSLVREEVTAIAHEAEVAGDLAGVLERLACPVTNDFGPVDLAAVTREVTGGRVPAPETDDVTAALARIGSEAARQLVGALLGQSRGARGESTPARVAVRSVDLSREHAAPLGLCAGRYVEISSRDDRAIVAARDLAATFEDRAFEASPDLSPLWLAEIVSVARAHGGALDLESGIRGTTVRVYLPAA